ncbi:hypothetical protein B0H66DRAFT_589067 [Apodospora peruviana]|uniref:LPXTG-domain-containing protein n=1 Tax=Apodospora peruviana TaxID=516989 RepID=A0AAE0IJT7_9PEZI|nr:hypothetical protein B0H66DRAFT_589067 [Apodospora peruviana]
MVSLYLSTARPRNIALLSLFLIAPLASALQVTPNSPCASVCQDDSNLDKSDPNSSRTRNSDIICKDVDLDTPVGTKWKNCMTCLQSSPFSQGQESDQMWFLYNLRYSLSYCIFAFPNATDVESTPCRTSMACGPLQDGIEHGVTTPSNITSFSYCSAGGGSASSPSNYEHCTPCVSAEGRTEYLANYLIALEAGCLQQPAPGRILGLNDTIFSKTHISIVDPTTVAEPAAPSSGLATNTIIGIAVAALAVIVITSAVTFVCYRKRKNRRARAELEAKYYGGGGESRHGRHHSSLSFQCQTHMASPRFWPGAGGGVGLTPVDEMGGHFEASPDQKLNGMRKQPSPNASSHNVSIHVAEDQPQQWESPYQPEAPLAHFNTRKNGSTTSVPLHHITTSIPAMPPNAYSSPSSAAVYSSPSESGGTISAVSAKSTTGLLAHHRPYVPAEHGVHAHGSPQPSLSAFTSPVSGTSASPLLKNQSWQQQDQQNNKKQQQRQQQQRKSFGSTMGSDGLPPPPPPGPPPPKVPRIAVPKKSAKKAPAVSGSPVESWEIQTAFKAPPE